MSKSVKALSIILILAALFGLVGSGLSAKDALDSKDYFSKKGEETDAAFDKLDDGLAQLAENEQAYLEGRDKYEDGLKQYEEGKKALADAAEQIKDGEKTLDENRDAYEKGKVQLAQAANQLQAGRAQLAAGKQELDAGEALFAKTMADQKNAAAQQAAGKNYDELDAQAKGAIDQGIDAKLQQARDVYNQVKKVEAQGLKKDDAINAVADAQVRQTVEANKDQIVAGVTAEVEKNNDKIVAAVTAEVEKNNEAIVAGVTQEVDKNNDAIVAGVTAYAKQQVTEGVKAAMPDMVAQEMTGHAYKDLDPDNQKMIDAYIASEEGQAKMNAAIEQKMASAEIQESIKQGVAAKRQELIDQGVADYKKSLIDDNVAAQKKKLIDENVAKTKDQLIKDNMPGAVDLIKTAYDTTESIDKLNAGRIAYAQGLKDLRNGEAQYYAGAAKLKEFEDGEAKLAAGKEEFAAGQEKLLEADKQLADGKAQLQQFEDGRDQIIDGLNTVIGTEPDNGLKSIADRLGKGFSFMKNDTDLDIDAGKKVVAAGRSYSADSGVLITKEVWTRVAGAAAAMLGSLLALLGGILGLKSKFKGSCVTSILSAILAAGGLVTLLVAGSHYSEQAGASAVKLVLAAAGVLAVAALANGVAALSASKKTTV